MDYTLLKTLAKTELHCHLDGSLSMEAVRQLAHMAKIEVPVSDQALKALITAPAHVTSLVEYLQTFDFIRPLLQTKEALQLAAYDVVKQAAEENVLYIEVRFAPELSMDQDLSAVEVVEAVLSGLKRAEEDFDIVAKGLVCGMRQSAPETNRQILSEVVSLAGQGLVGFDYAGDEHGFPPAQMAELISYTQSLGLPMTFHAGECGCANHISDAIKMGIKRTGHTTAIHNQPELLADFVAAGVTAEICLTSNLQTKAAPTVADFPYLELKEAGAKISINTDNRTVSDTNLTKEYGLFVEHFDCDPADFLRHNQTAIEASFASDAEKAVLLSKLKKSYAPFL